MVGLSLRNGCIAVFFLAMGMTLAQEGNGSSPATEVVAFSVAGRVLDSNGQPIGGSEVVLQRLCSAGGWSDTKSNFDVASRSRPFTDLTREDGSYVVSVPMGLWEVIIEADGFETVVSAEIPVLEPVRLPTARLRESNGFAGVDETERAQGIPGSGEHWKLLTLEPNSRSRGNPSLRLKDGGVEVTGSVLDIATRRQVEGALVWAMIDGSCASRSKSDLEGNYRLVFQLADPDAQVFVKSVAPGYLLSNQATPVALGGSRLTLALEQAPGRVSGKVLDVRGKPLGDVTLVAKERNSYIRVSASDNRGRFDLRRLPVDRPINLTAFSPGFLPTSIKVPSIGSKMWVGDVELVLTQGTIVWGRVVDGKDNEPVGNAEVLLAPHRDSPPIQVSRTTQEGFFLFENVPPELLGVEVRAPGYGWRWEVVPRSRSADLNVGELSLQPELSLSGRVVDLEGQGISGADVFLDRTPGDSISSLDGRPIGRPNAVTSDGGDFSIGGLQEIDRAALRVHASGYQAKRIDFVVSSWDPEDGIEMEEALNLCGVVTDTTERPVFRATVYRTYPNAIQVELEETTTDRFGRFCLESRPESVHLAVMADGYFGKQVSISEAEWAAEGIAIELGQEAVIEGRVLHADGEPAYRARIKALGPASGIDERTVAGSMIVPIAITGADGRFRLEGVGPGPNQLDVKLDSESDSAVIDASPGLNERNFVLKGRQTYAISGMLVDMSDIPLAGVKISIKSDRQGRVLSTGSDAAGQFRIEKVPPGVYRFHLSDDLVASAETRGISIVESDHEGLRIKAEEGSTLYGELSGFTDFDSVSVSLSGPALLSAGLDSLTSTYRITGVPAGQWRVEARETGGGAVGETVIVGPGDSKRLDLFIGPKSVVYGAVSDDHGPLRGVDLAFRSLHGGRNQWFTTDSSGRFEARLPNLGSYLVAVYGDSTPGLPVHLERVDLQPEDRLDIRVAPRELRGVVLSHETHEALAGARVTITDSISGEVGSTITDSAGAFLFSASPLIDAVIEVSRPGSQSLLQTLDSRSIGAVLRLELHGIDHFD